MPEEKAKVHINSVSWGNVVINGQKFDQVIISGSKVFPREVEKLERLFGTTHQIGDWEQELLLSANPEVVVIGNGWSGLLKIKDELKEKFSEKGIELRVKLTAVGVVEFNKLTSQGKRTNALIHTTC